MQVTSRIDTMHYRNQNKDKEHSGKYPGLLLQRVLDARLRKTDLLQAQVGAELFLHFVLGARFGWKDRILIFFLLFSRLSFTNSFFSINFYHSITDLQFCVHFCLIAN